MQIKIKYLLNYNLEDWGEMKYSYPNDACFDARAAIEKPINLLVMTASNYVTAPHIAIIPLGFSIELPIDYELQVRPRSGLAYKHGISLLNSPGVIDSGYRGEVSALLINLGHKNLMINPGDRVCQCKVATVPYVELVTVSELTQTSRGEGGFGHTGVT